LASLFYCVSAAAAEAVTANSEEDNQSDDNEPNDFILKKLAEAVHINVLSFLIYWRSEIFTLQYNNM